VTFSTFPIHSPFSHTRFSSLLLSSYPCHVGKLPIGLRFPCRSRRPQYSSVFHISFFGLTYCTRITELPSLLYLQYDRSDIKSPRKPHQRQALFAAHFSLFFCVISLFCSLHLPFAPPFDDPTTPPCRPASTPQEALLVPALRTLARDLAVNAVRSDRLPLISPRTPSGLLLRLGC
jgi:hypothetical protein